jgi:hypothetical protein
MTKAFNFEAGGRTYTCTVEVRKAPPAGSWWWFAVTDDQQRYAPFEVSSADTEKSVKKRIIAYYENLLEVRARPVEPRQHWAHRGRPAKQPEPQPEG